jgi:ketosteroid isomerase-like protein
MRMSVTVLFGCLAIGQVAQPQTGKEEDLAVATVRTFVRANEQSDLDLIMSTFDEGATLFNPVGDRPYRLSGKAQIRQAFSEVFSRRSGPITITPRDVSVQMFGEMAIVTAHLREVPPQPIRDPISFARRTFVLRRVGDQWLIVHHHASNFQWNPPGK